RAVDRAEAANLLVVHDVPELGVALAAQQELLAVRVKQQQARGWRFMVAQAPTLDAGGNFPDCEPGLGHGAVATGGDRFAIRSNDQVGTASYAGDNALRKV